MKPFYPTPKEPESSSDCEHDFDMTMASSFSKKSCRTIVPSRVIVAPKPVNLPSTFVPVRKIYSTYEIKDRGGIPNFEQTYEGSDFVRGIIDSRCKVLDGSESGPFPALPVGIVPQVATVHYQNVSWPYFSFSSDSLVEQMLDPLDVVVFGHEVRIYIPSYKEGTTMEGASAKQSSCEMFRLSDWIEVNKYVKEKGYAFWDTMSHYTIKCWCNASETPRAFSTWKNAAMKANRLRGSARTRAMEKADNILLEVYQYVDENGDWLDRRFKGRERRKNAKGTLYLFEHGLWSFCAVKGDRSDPRSPRMFGGDVAPCYSSCSLFQRCYSLT